MRISVMVGSRSSYLEIGLAEGDVVQVHGKAVVRDKVRQLVIGSGP